jgi:hypothetical protein
MRNENRREQKISRKQHRETSPAQRSGHRLFGDPAARYLVFQEGDRGLATGEATSAGASRRYGTPGSASTTRAEES